MDVGSQSLVLHLGKRRQVNAKYDGTITGREAADMLCGLLQTPNHEMLADASSRSKGLLMPTAFETFQQAINHG
jgi:hypothetical protein